MQGLIVVLLEGGGFSPGREPEEARNLWAAVERDSPRLHSAFDGQWFAGLLATRAPSPAASQQPLALGAGRGDGERRQDWGEAPDTLGFIGRVDELATLRRWVLDERVRLVVILGMGGIGKTSLAAKLAEDVAPSFEGVYWRGLRDAPLPREWLAGVIGFLSDQKLVPPTNESEQIVTLLQLLRERRCLLVLDNSEALLEPGQREGSYRPGMAGYGRLLQAIGEASHQSCLVLTSREGPPQLAGLGMGAVRTIQLGGLGVDDAQALLAPKHLSGTAEQWAELIARFGGNGLALKVVSESIRELFGSEIGHFLEATSGGGLFGGIRRVLAEQVDRSSPLEQQILRVLAVEREPLRLAELHAALGPGVSNGVMLEAVEALRHRSLVEHAKAPGVATGSPLVGFTLQSVVLEYVIERLVDAVADEIARGEPALLIEQPFVKALAKDYVRQTQERLIATPILQRLKTHVGAGMVEQRLLALLEGWRGKPLEKQGYGPGNVINLLRLLRGDLRGQDLARLALRQAYLAQIDAQDASLQDAHLAGVVLAEAFDFPVSVALTGDGALLAVGTMTGQICVWRVVDRTPVWSAQAHSGLVWNIAFSADGQLLASGGTDGTLRLWETPSGRPLANLQAESGGVWGVALSGDACLLASGTEDGKMQLWDIRAEQRLGSFQAHTGSVWGMALSSDAHLLASSGADGTVRLWDTSTQRPLATLLGHTGTVYRLALSADGHLLASAGGDGTLRLWDAGSGQPLATLEGHTDGAWGVALSPDGQLLVSSGADGTVRLWETRTGQRLATLQGHNGAVAAVAISADGELVASGGAEGTVRLWERSTGRPLAILHGHSGAIEGLALSADGRRLATGSPDGTVRVWDPRSASSAGQAADTDRPVARIQGHAGSVGGVALSPDGGLLASGGEDGTVRLWDATTGSSLGELSGATGAIWAVALSADSRLVASGSDDGSVRLWDRSTGQIPRTLHAHTGTVWGVAVSADGQLLATSAVDGFVRLWEASTGRLLETLQGHTGTVYRVAFSADGQLLASAGGDGTVRLWQTRSGLPVMTLQGHTGGVWGVALSPDGQLVASGGTDGTVRLWEASTGNPRAVLQGHTGTVAAVALSTDGQLVASGGFDGTVRLWGANTGASLRVLRPERRYERMDITGLTGVTEAQRTALLALGAVNHHTRAEFHAARSVSDADMRARKQLKY